MSYFEACSYLHRDHRFRTKVDSKTSHNELKIAELPPVLWRMKARNFVNYCHAHLMKRQDMLDYLQGRGFKSETIIKQRFGYCYDPIHNGDFYRSRSSWGLPDMQNDKGNLARLWLPVGIVIPYHNIIEEVLKIKIRRLNLHPDDTLPKYVVVSGSSRQPSCFGDVFKIPTVIVESEFDAVLIDQELEGTSACIALGGASVKPDRETHEKLSRSPLLLFALDFDEAGKKVYGYWRQKYRNLKPWPAPGAKSPGDAHQKGVNLREWILAGIKHYEKYKSGSNF